MDSKDFTLGGHNNDCKPKFSNTFRKQLHIRNSGLKSSESLCCYEGGGYSSQGSRLSHQQSSESTINLKPEDLNILIEELKSYLKALYESPEAVEADYKV